LVQAISDYYHRNLHSTLNTAQVALRVAARLPGRPSQPGGEVYKGRHGFFDGQWWYESIAPEQLGYVEGYLLCLGRLTTASQAQKLATAITAWYKAHPSREERSIAYVLADQLKSRRQ
jgi:hypothetical protein